MKRFILVCMMLVCAGLSAGAPEDAQATGAGLQKIAYFDIALYRAEVLHQARSTFLSGERKPVLTIMEHARPARETAVESMQAYLSAVSDAPGKEALPKAGLRRSAEEHLEKMDLLIRDAARYQTLALADLSPEELAVEKEKHAAYLQQKAKLARLEEVALMAFESDAREATLLYTQGKLSTAQLTATLQKLSAQCQNDFLVANPLLSATCDYESDGDFIISRQRQAAHDARRQLKRGAVYLRFGKLAFGHP